MKHLEIALKKDEGTLCGGSLARNLYPKQEKGFKNCGLLPI